MTHVRNDLSRYKVHGLSKNRVESPGWQAYNVSEYKGGM